MYTKKKNTKTKRTRNCPGLAGSASYSLAADKKTQFSPSYLFRKTFSEANLQKAFKEVQDKGKAPGCDGVFAVDLKTDTAKRLHNQLIDGTYDPKPSLKKEIRQNGKIRGLGLPCAEDRIVQLVIKELLTRVFEPLFSPNSFAYREGIGRDTAALKVSQYIKEGYKTAISIDLSKYFDTIPHESLIKAVHSVIGDHGITRLIRNILEAGVEDKGKVTYSDRGTPQGGIISPLLANFFMTAFDKERDREHTAYIRYADDFLILTKRNSKAPRIMERITTELEGMDLTVNLRKSEVVPVQDLEYLGFHFDKQGNIHLADYALDRARTRISERLATVRVAMSIHHGKGVPPNHGVRYHILARILSCEDPRPLALKGVIDYTNGWCASYAVACHRPELKELDQLVSTTLTDLGLPISKGKITLNTKHGKELAKVRLFSQHKWHTSGEEAPDINGKKQQSGASESTLTLKNISDYVIQKMKAAGDLYEDGRNHAHPLFNSVHQAADKLIKFLSYYQIENILFMPDKCLWPVLKKAVASGRFKNVFFMNYNEALISVKNAAGTYSSFCKYSFGDCQQWHGQLPEDTAVILPTMAFYKGMDMMVNPGSYVKGPPWFLTDLINEKLINRNALTFAVASHTQELTREIICENCISVYRADFIVTSNGVIQPDVSIRNLTNVFDWSNGDEVRNSLVERFDLRPTYEELM